MQSDSKEEILEQDLSEKSSRRNNFGIRLLFEELTEFPDIKFMLKVMSKKLGKTESPMHSDNLVIFTAQKYAIQTSDEGFPPPQLLLMKCTEIDEPLMDPVAESQTRNCPESKEIMNRCRYQIVASDMLTSVLDTANRTKLITRYTEALAEMFPTCQAILFDNSKKIHTRKSIIHCSVPEPIRFVYYAINVRFFRIGETSDFLVDTLGMDTLFRPDLQYHFHDLDPNLVINHAYNMALQLLSSEEEIESGDTVNGIEDGEITDNVRWKVQYEDSMIQPSRTVLDVNTGRFASGNRGS